MFLSLLLSHALFESTTSLIVHPLFTLQSLPLLLSPGILAFFMTTTEFELIRRTGVVTLCIGGIFKEVLTVLAGTIVFQDHLAVSNIWGVLVTLGGISWYNWIKIQKMNEADKLRKEDFTDFELVDRHGLDDDVFSLDEED